MNVEQFAEQILQTAKRFRWLSVEDVRYAKNRVKIRLAVDVGYIDIFYNSETERISYTYIEFGKRIFGADNMKIGWHIHPFEDPTRHDVTGRAVSLEEFLQTLEDKFISQNYQ